MRDTISIDDSQHVESGAELLELSADLYRKMYLIRSVEQTLLDMFGQGLIGGTVHTAIGQETSAVGVIGALNAATDVVFSNHRGHGHFIAYSDNVEGLIAEIAGRRTGVCGGIGGSQNLHIRNMYTGGIQGGLVPCAVGAALAEKIKSTQAICVSFLGDGTMAQGTVYEGMNVASLWSLPILFVLEDNHYAQSTPKEHQHAGDIYSRASAFCIECSKTTGDDVFSVLSAARSAVRYVREHGRPFFLGIDTYRLAPHSKGDDTRSPEEVATYRSRDPLTQHARRLPAETRCTIERMVDERIRSAVELALSERPQTLAEVRARL